MHRIQLHSQLMKICIFQLINHSAADNINFSTQKSLIAHAQDKISLFSAQQGLKAIAAKGKVELQAQDDAIETIARQKIKMALD